MAAQWTERELDYLRECYGELSTRQIAEDLGRTVSSVDNKASKMKLKVGWTEKDLAYLRQHYTQQPVTVTIQALGRSKSAITQKAMQLGLSRVVTSSGTGSQWSPKEKAFVRENIDRLGLEACAAELNRSVESVRSHTKREGIKLNRMPRPGEKGSDWSDEDIQFMRDNLLHMGYSGVAKELGRTTEATRWQAKANRITIRELERKTGLRANRSGKPLAPQWTPEEDHDILSLKMKGDSWEAIGEKVNRTPEATRYRYKSLMKSFELKYPGVPLTEESIDEFIFETDYLSTAR